MKLSLLFFRWFAGMPFRALGLKGHFYLRNHYKREMKTPSRRRGEISMFITKQITFNLFTRQPTTKWWEVR